MELTNTLSSMNVIEVFFNLTLVFQVHGNDLKMVISFVVNMSI
jgi:hypothetical protein